MITTRTIKSAILRRAAARATGHCARPSAIATGAARSLFFGLLALSFIPGLASAADAVVQASAPGLSLPASSLPTQPDSAVPQPNSAVPAAAEAQAAPAHIPKRANFEQEHVSHDARSVADWVVDSGDNHSLPFAIVDKLNAKVFVFHPDGQLRGAAAALLGLAKGDDSVPGIGERKLSLIRPEEKTTPAGRFVAALGHRAGGEEILWVDYDDAISMHRVINTNLKERRPQRLASPTIADNRISFGCINVPIKFYEKVVSPAFTGTDGIVYVLPETRPARAVFASYDVYERAQAQSENQSAPTQFATRIGVIEK